MRTFNFSFLGKTYTLYAPVGLFFEIYDRYGYGDILPVTGCMENSPEGWSALCWLISRMADYGRMLARLLGDDPGPKISEETLAMQATIWDVTRMRAAVRAELEAVLAHSDAPDGETDLTLERLREAEEKKTAAAE